MAVNWKWKSKVGEILYKDLKRGENWKLEMFTGNMMCCFIYRYTKVNEETGKRERFYNFFYWWNDIGHAKRCLKDMRLENLPLGNHKVRKIRLDVQSNSPYSNKEMLRLADILVKMGYKVELY